MNRDRSCEGGGRTVSIKCLSVKLLAPSSIPSPFINSFVCLFECALFLFRRVGPTWMASWRGPRAGSVQIWRNSGGSSSRLHFGKPVTLLTLWHEASSIFTPRAWASGVLLEALSYAFKLSFWSSCFSCCWSFVFRLMWHSFQKLQHIHINICRFFPARWGMLFQQVWP